MQIRSYLQPTQRAQLVKFRNVQIILELPISFLVFSLIKLCWALWVAIGILFEGCKC